MNYRVLIVDDEPWTRDVIKRLVKWDSLNLEVVGEASDGKAGLLLVEELKPHIVITDMCMPGMSGVEMLKHIIDTHIKLIVISGYDDFHYVREAVKSNVMDYLLKPINPEELNDVLNKCILSLEQEYHQDLFIYEPDTFLNVAWFYEYNQLRDLVKGALKDVNSPLAEQLLSEIHTLITNHEGDMISTGMIMKLFYDLVWLLEHFIASEGFLLKEAVMDKLVFSSTTSFDDVMHHLSKLYVKTIDYIQESLYNSKRMDVEEIKNYVDLRYVENITLKSVADHFYISQEYLSRCFKKHTGINFSEYIVMRRMEKAKEMILEHHMQIKNVAELLGYNDNAHFYKNFKKYHGVTPGEMRKNIPD